MGKKKYGLKCFWCRKIFNSKDEVARVFGEPVCYECLSDPIDTYNEEDWIDDPEYPTFDDRDDIY